MGVVLVCALGSAACSTPAPTADNGVPPAAVVDADPLVWAALGGDETLVDDPARAGRSWTQQVLARLPASTQLLALATEDATVLDALEAQMATLRASPVVPEVATVWLGAGDRVTGARAFRSGLAELVEALRVAGVERVVLVARTDPGSAARAADVESVATSVGAELVTVDGLLGDPGDPGAQDDIADVLAPAVAR